MQLRRLFQEGYDLRDPVYVLRRVDHCISSPIWALGGVYSCGVLLGPSLSLHLMSRQLAKFRNSDALCARAAPSDF